MTTGNDSNSSTQAIQPPPDAWPPPPGQLSIFGVIDQLGADFYVGKAIEFILGHREDTAGYAEDLRSAQQMLEQKIRRLAGPPPPTRSGAYISAGRGGSGSSGGNGTPG